MALVFFSAMAVAFSGAVMPGALLTYTIKQSLLSGPKAGFIIIIGHAILELALITLIFLGFDMILQSRTAQTVIGIAGGLLLVYMGVGMIVSAARDRLRIETDGKAGSKNMVISGFFISAMNPYFLIWWAVIGLGFLLQAYKSFGIPGVLLFYVGHIATDFIWYGFISTIIGKTRNFIKAGPYRIIVAVLGGLLIYFGAGFFIKAAASIL